MSVLVAILIGSAAVFSWKLIGYLIPERYLDHGRVKNIASLLTIALLAALVGVQGFTSQSQIMFDARIPALILAAILLKLRAPFIVTVAAAAALAAIIRFFL